MLIPTCPFPTQFCASQFTSLLNLVLTNKENMITNITSRDPVGKSDHIVIQVSAISRTSAHIIYMQEVTICPCQIYFLVQIVFIN